MAVNLASKYSSKVVERFTRDSQALIGTSNEYEFTGVATVNVYSVPTAAMNDYARTGASRYGTPSELQNTIQSMTLTKDRSFTFTIDRGNKLQTQMVMDAGKALSRQMKEVITPEIDTYIFYKQADKAKATGKFAVTVATKSNAYELFLAGQETLGDLNVPDAGRIAFCSYKYANMLKQDSSFMKYSNLSQEMIIKGVLGEVDGTKIVKVPKARLPRDCSFLLVHPVATVAPKQLEDYKIHDNPPGISGWLVEGRIIYDAFILDEKVDALYLNTGSGVLGGGLTATSVAGTVATNDTIIGVTSTVGLLSGHTYKYKVGTTATAVTYGADLSAWTAMPVGGLVAASTNTVLQIAELDATGKALAVAQTAIVKKA
jgi:hypothetical protein